MKQILLYCTLSILGLGSCNLIFEEDLSKRKVDLLSPPDPYTTFTQTQTFVWDSIPDVSQYRFQIVSKRFDFIEDYTLDTLIRGTTLTIALQPKEYQWRVKGLNNSSESDYYTYNLAVVQDTSLVNQIVNIIAPTSNLTYEKDSVAFWWTALGLAGQYQLQVATHPSFNSQTLRADTTTQQDYVYLIRKLGLGTFYYRMRAMRVGIDTTVYTAIQQFSINMKPVHSTPANSSIQTIPLNIDWESASNIIKDSLLLYFNNTNVPYKQVELHSSNYTFSSLDTTGQGSGTYYWQVKSVGANNVQSGKSNLWQFRIN